MRYQLLGPSGLRVSELCLGTMTFGEDWGWGASREECQSIFEAFAAAGGNFIDTANFYTKGSSERIVGELLGAERERFVLATKFTLNMHRGDPNGGGNHRKNIVQSLEASLRRLKTDYIDLYWLHVWDFTTPVEEIMRTLDDLVRAGKILYVGISDTPAWIVSQANAIATLRGWSPFVGIQIEYNLIERTVERDLTPMAQALGLSVLAWSPLAGGLLTGKFKSPDHGHDGGRFGKHANAVSERNRDVIDAVGAVAVESGFTPAQVALAWLRSHPQVIPIIGARKRSQFEDNLNVLNCQLSPEQLARLNEASAVDLGFPHNFVASSDNHNMIFGGLQDKIVFRNRG